MYTCKIGEGVDAAVVRNKTGQQQWAASARQCADCAQERLLAQESIGCTRRGDCSLECTAAPQAEAGAPKAGGGGGGGQPQPTANGRSGSSGSPPNLLPDAAAVASGRWGSLAERAKARLRCCAPGRGSHRAAALGTRLCCISKVVRGPARARRKLIARLAASLSSLIAKETSADQ